MRHQRRRNQQIRKGIEFASKSSAPKQVGLLMNSFSSQEKEIFSEETGLGEIKISAEEMISLKANLGMPWEKLKKMGR